MSRRSSLLPSTPPAAPVAPVALGGAPAAESAPESLVEDLEEFDDLTQVSAPAVGVAPAVELRHLVVESAAHGQRLDAWLSSQILAHSRSHLKALIEAGHVQVGGQAITTASRKVAQGQAVGVSLQPTAQSQAFVAEPMDLPVVFEDAHLMVINKPAGLVVHPAAGNWQGTLMNGLLAHHAGAASLPRAGIVHRLDKDTSGLMVVGKTQEAVTALSRAIAAREVKRQYLALAHGEVSESMSVCSSIGRDPVTRVRMAVVPGGKPARTDVQRLLCGVWQSEPLNRHDDLRPTRLISGVLCTLHTGRTHQIRVHLSSRKHPLVADALYGGAQALGLTRQALHAARLGFAHPITAEPLQFEAPLPPDMAQAWAWLEEGATVPQTGV
ncbi:MAG: RluA family pseudouridine synthase [Burkholderiales bacterium]|nr:RluA family pseudouridine synthase [Burkholderiales bacterium]MBH2017248.1 RluA family pseudouridine synthase [Burkholderiales bacterium]